MVKNLRFFNFNKGMISDEQRPDTAVQSVTQRQDLSVQRCSAPANCVTLQESFEFSIPQQPHI